MACSNRLRPSFLVENELPSQRGKPLGLFMVFLFFFINASCSGLAPAAHQSANLPERNLVLTASAQPQATLDGTPTSAEAIHIAISPTAPAIVSPKPYRVTGGQSIGDPYMPELGNTGYDVQHYSLRFTLDPGQPVVYGRTTIQAVSTLDNLGEISLDFAGYTIDRLTIDRKEAVFYRQKEKLFIKFHQPMNMGKRFTLEVTYSGETETHNSETHQLDLGLVYLPDIPVIYAMSEPDGAHRWYPCNDHPRDKATFTTEISVPEQMLGISNGTLIDVTTEMPGVFPDGRPGDRYTWDMKQPMATYLATVVVGQYELLAEKTPQGTRLRTYVFPEGNADFEQGYAQVGNAIDWMSDKFGVYPFDAFGYVMIGDTNFSMETQSMVMESSSMGSDVLIHEMAHQWFGDWVSLDSWADIWRNEGFATYVTELYLERNDPEGLEETVNRWTQYVAANPASFPLNNPPKENMFDTIIYVQGALLAHDLHQTMGDEAFFQGLKTYFQQYGGRSASLEQFQAELERACGQSLDAVFAEWFPTE